MLKDQFLLKNVKMKSRIATQKEEKMHEKMSRGFLNQKLILSSSLKISSASWLSMGIADD